jgi:DNA-binding transcriptional LysR family regulator
VLADQVKVAVSLYAIYPHQQYQLAKVRAFIDFLQEVFGDDNTREVATG